MAGRPKFYSPQTVALTVFGVPITGFAPDSSIEISQVSEGVMSECGIDGEVAVSVNADNRHRVKVKLMQTSEANAVFSAQYRKMRSLKNGGGVGTFNMEDLQGGTYCHASACWVVKMPDSEMKKTAGPREWILELADPDRLEGGN